MFVNLTPHAIVLRTEAGDNITIPPSGDVARVATTEVITSSVAGIPVITRTMGKPEGLPAEGTPVLVSAMVAAACVGRKGVFAPDTGATAIRNDKGHVVAVTRLVAA